MADRSGTDNKFGRQTYFGITENNFINNEKRNVSMFNGVFNANILKHVEIENISVE